jgi:hypothetical protein
VASRTQPPLFFKSMNAKPGARPIDRDTGMPIDVLDMSSLQPIAPTGGAPSIVLVRASLAEPFSGLSAPDSGRPQHRCNSLWWRRSKTVLR